MRLSSDSIVAMHGVVAVWKQLGAVPIFQRLICPCNVSLVQRVVVNQCVCICKGGGQ